MFTPPTSFVRALFLGRVEGAAILPFPLAGDEERETTETIANMVREWAADAIDPEAIDREKRIPEAVLDGLRALGLFGLTIPEAHGGAGMGQRTYAAVMEALAQRCASTVTVLGGHLGLGSKAVVLYGTDAQKARWLPELASGERIAAFALTEAGAGSDAAAQRATADELPDGSWKLNGRKIWITNGGFAGFFTVFARTVDPAHPDAPSMQRPISAFLVPRDAPGVTVGVPEDKMGLRGSSTTDVGLADVVLPADALIGPRGGGFKVALNVLNSGRHGLAACCIGQAKLARDLAVDHAREREQFGRPIAAFGMIKEMLAGMDADIYAMEAGTALTAGLIEDRRGETMLEAACCKLFATERLWAICNDALQVSGGTGFMREYPYERILRDARINLIFEGTNQVLRMMLSLQGLRPYSHGADRARPAPEPPRLAGVHAALADERAAFEALVPGFAAHAAAVAARHGAGVRDAQHDQHRLADMACALFHMGAVLSRASAALEAGALDERQASVARLALARLERSFAQSALAAERPHDTLVDAVARGATGV
jgi:acyl-CoA dehydrogenase family protein 9